MSDERQQITWVGEQRLMEGYCGRAIVTGTAATDANDATDEGAARPIVIVSPDGPRGPVIRIGPKPIRATPAAAATDDVTPGNSEARAA